MRREDIQIGQRFIKNARILPPENPVPCPEPNCRGMLRRTYSHKLQRFYYFCEVPGCDGSVGCSPDGVMHGIPSDSKVKKARQRAHNIFDRLWKDGYYTRGGAYKEMAKQMGIDPLHIAELDEAQCDRLVQLVNDHIDELDAPDDDDDGWFEVDNG